MSLEALGLQENTVNAGFTPLTFFLIDQDANGIFNCKFFRTHDVPLNVFLRLQTTVHTVNTAKMF